MTDIVGRDRTPIRSLTAESAIIAYMTRIDAHGRTIVIVVHDGVTLLDAVGPAEVFAEANRFGARYRLLFASVDGNDVSTSLGVRFAVSTGLADVQSADTVLVAGGDNLVARPIDPALVDAVKTLPRKTRRIASVCTGAFILAQAGLLTGRRATTHWREADLLARAYPEVIVEPDAIFIRDGTVYTSAGVTAGIDLALALVEEDHGTDVVRDVARSLVVYLKRGGGQSQFSVMVEANPPRKSPLRLVTDTIAANPAADHSLKNLAARASLSISQLNRLFRTQLGTTPARFVEMIRIDAARAALDNGYTVTDATRIAGFGSTETLRRVFVTQLGVSPKAYRDRFCTTRPGRFGTGTLAS
jgi:transcriptional regulator GlxA family with amidase domain